MSNNYAGLRRAFGKDEEGARRCATRLLAMRQGSLAPVRKRKSDTSLLLATWNIRDFDSNKFGWGPRLAESFYYIAEVISSFDLVAIQEVNRNLSALERVMAILGREWDYIVTDTTAAKIGGNDERMAFVYNTEKVWFRKVAGEIVLPEGQTIIPSGSKDPDAEPLTLERNQFARSPFLVAFQSGWFRFSLCTVHLYFGAASGPKLDRRVREIADLVQFFADRQDIASQQDFDRLGAVENYILLGDFNVVSPKHRTMKALADRGFEVPSAIDGAKVRKKGQHFYDQIAVRVKDERFEVVSGGMVDVFEDVFRDGDGDPALYTGKVPEEDKEPDEQYRETTEEGRYRKWRTWQMSDHLPLWVEVRTDFSDRYLQDIADGKPARRPK